MSNCLVQSAQPSTHYQKTLVHIVAGLLLFIGLATAANAQQVSFFDGTFSTAWVGSVAGITGTVTYSFLPSIGGGYPGGYEKESHTLTDSGGLAFLYLANFNPVNTFTGSFKSLSYSYDLVNPGTHAVFYAIAVKQTVNSVTNVYIPDKTQIDDIINLANPWGIGPNPYFTMGLTASQFCRIPSNANYGNDIDCTSNPDFSNPAQQTVFGYVVGNSFSGHGKGKYKTGIDNWCVVIDGASGPGGAGRPCKGL